MLNYDVMYILMNLIWLFLFQMILNLAFGGMQGSTPVSRLQRQLYVPTWQLRSHFMHRITADPNERYRL